MPPARTAMTASWARSPPLSARIVETTTAMATLGPLTSILAPPSRAATSPTTMKQCRPATGPMPDRMPRAMTIGMADANPTVPAFRSAQNFSRLYGSRFSERRALSMVLRPPVSTGTIPQAA